MKSQIEKLISEIEKFDTHKLFSIDFDKDEMVITINYEYNLHFAENVIGYNLEEWAQNFPETFNLDGHIELTIEEDGTFERDTRANVYDCQVMKQGHGDFDGYQFDIEIRKENIIDYLAMFRDDVETISKLSHSKPEEIEILFDDQTHVNDDYNNTYFKIGKKSENYFYHESSNHIRHNEHDYDGRSEWEPIENFEENHEHQSITDVYSHYFGEELENVLKQID